MAITQPTFRPIVRSGASSLEITNLSVGTSEVSHALQVGLRTLLIRSRTKAELYIAFVSGESSTKYLTIPKGTTLTLTDLEFDSKTLYIRADQSNDVEIVETYV